MRRAVGERDDLSAVANSMYKRIIQGWRLDISPISSLSEDEYTYLLYKLSTFAVSKVGVFGSNILKDGDTITAYYSREEYAQETRNHLPR